jgi:hypothetical protein
MTRRIYADEDPTEELTVRLHADGHAAISVREMGHKGRTDPWQLAYAARERRILITCNYKHFEMLHEAWTSWSAEWEIAARVPHSGILVIPNGREISIDKMVEIVREILAQESDLNNRYFRWRHSTGWQEL